MGLFSGIVLLDFYLKMSEGEIPASYYRLVHKILKMSNGLRLVFKVC